MRKCYDVTLLDATYQLGSQTSLVAKKEQAFDSLSKVLSKLFGSLFFQCQF